MSSNNNGPRSSHNNNNNQVTRERERVPIPVPKVICCHSAIQRYLAPQQFSGGRPPGLMVIPAFTFSNHFFLRIGDALGTKK